MGNDDVGRVVFAVVVLPSSRLTRVHGRQQV